MKTVTIHSDGACQGNPGPGGWAAVLTSGAHRKELSGGAAATTNNRMEMQGAVEALRALKEPCEVQFHTDSQYVRNGIMKWVRGWKRNGWMTMTKQPVKNEDLWRALDEQVSRHQVTWHWLKGHAGHRENERCDVLAKAQAAAFRQKLTAAELAAQLRAFQAQQRGASAVGDLL